MGQVLVIKMHNIILQDRGSGHKIYIFKESTRHYIINCKGQGRKEVIYLYVADLNYTRGVYKSTELSYRGPYGGVP